MHQPIETRFATLTNIAADPTAQSETNQYLHNGTLYKSLVTEQNTMLVDEPSSFRTLELRGGSCEERGINSLLDGGCASTSGEQNRDDTADSIQSTSGFTFHLPHPSASHSTNLLGKSTQMSLSINNCQSKAGPQIIFPTLSHRSVKLSREESIPYILSSLKKNYSRECGFSVVGNRYSVPLLLIWISNQLTHFLRMKDIILWKSTQNLVYRDEDGDAYMDYLVQLCYIFVKLYQDAPRISRS